MDHSIEFGGSWKAGNGNMSYMSVVRKNDGLAEETIWLQIEKGVV